MKQLKAGTANLLSAGDEARAGFWRWLASFLILCLGFVAIAFAFHILAPWFYSENVAPSVSDEGLLYDRTDDLIYTLLMFAFIAAFIPAIALSLLVVRLTVSQLIAPFGRIQWRIIAKTTLATFCIMAVSLLVTLWASVPAEDYYFDPLPAALWYYLPLILIMIALQASAEELLLRGYILQMVGRLTRSWWMILLIVAGLFFALHLENPEVGIWGWYAYLSYALSALMFTLLALLTGRLEYSIGTHIGWNWSILIADTDPSSAAELYTGFGAIVYSGPMEASLSDAATEILVHLIIALWCLTDHAKRANRVGS